MAAIALFHTGEIVAATNRNFAVAIESSRIFMALKSLVLTRNVRFPPDTRLTDQSRNPGRG